jgi:hypothetical protein
MEALATGLPILMTPTGNYKHYISLGVKGILSNFKPDEACAQLKKMLTSASHYQEHIDTLAHFNCPTWEQTFEPLVLKWKP